MRDAAEARARIKTIIRDYSEKRERWGLDDDDADDILNDLVKIEKMMIRPDRYYAECPMCGAEVEHEAGDRSAQCHECGEVIDLTVPAHETGARR